MTKHCRQFFFGFYTFLVTLIIINVMSVTNRLQRKVHNFRFGVRFIVDSDQLRRRQISVHGSRDVIITVSEQPVVIAVLDCTENHLRNSPQSHKNVVR